MATFLFWNIRNKNIADVIATACDEHEVDLLILAECSMPSVEILPTLNEGSTRKFVMPINYSSKLSFFTRYPIESVKPVSDAGGIAIRTVRPPVGLEVLLVALHLRSKKYRTDVEQAVDAVEVAQAIAEAEARVGHLNSLIIGDLNMDPFEVGVFGAKGMHGVMDKRI